MYPKKTLTFRFAQFCATVSALVFTVGLLGFGAHFDYSINLRRSGLFSFPASVLEIILSIIIALQAAYIYDSEREKNRNGYRTLEQIRNDEEELAIKEFSKKIKKG